ncbi:MAG TPA: OmpW family outer membrane protein [Opitutaceae bacterium]|nr:OmpW family outer membrane protein [Opitutaceae bacterium]
MNKSLRLLAGSALLLLSLAAAQAASPWSVRVRATYLETVDKSDPFTALGIHFGRDAVSVNDKLIPEIDISYAFTDTLYAELVLTIPQMQTVKLAGVGKLGTFIHLPPTLMFQYRANPTGKIHPYAGLGVNYTLVWSDHLSVAGVPLSLENSSFGLAAQIGLDWDLTDHWGLNIDVKKANIRSKVFAGSTSLTEARLDPLLYSVGVRYAF